MIDGIELYAYGEIEVPDGLYCNQNYAIARIGENLFSMCRLGNGVDLHIASSNVWSAHDALTKICRWILDSFSWCEMIIGTSNKRGVIKMAKRCGFEEFARNGENVALAKVRK